MKRKWTKWKKHQTARSQASPLIILKLCFSPLQTQPGCETEVYQESKCWFVADLLIIINLDYIWFIVNIQCRLICRYWYHNGYTFTIFVCSPLGHSFYTQSTTCLFSLMLLLLCICWFTCGSFLVGLASIFLDFLCFFLYSFLFNFNPLYVPYIHQN